MKNTFIVTIAALAVTSAAAFFGMFLAEKYEEKLLEETTQQADRQVTDTPKEAEKYEYIIAEYEGKLAVFLPNRVTPKKVFDIYVSTLPQKDREDLAKGVGAADYTQLLSLLEDYSS
ncbi:MAG: hypothetical protein IKV41_01060 [Oscillospiraceae bacterium]|nr:hypothetical protein [Oscillospiraceae bacterium]